MICYAYTTTVEELLQHFKNKFSSQPVHNVNNVTVPLQNLLHTTEGRDMVLLLHVYDHVFTLETYPFPQGSILVRGVSDHGGAAKEFKYELLIEATAHPPPFAMSLKNQLQLCSVRKNSCHPLQWNKGFQKFSNDPIQREIRFRI
jgi:hypothetical protein